MDYDRFVGGAADAGEDGVDVADAAAVVVVAVDGGAVAPAAVVVAAGGDGISLQWS